MRRGFVDFILTGLVVLALSGCAFQRSSDAAEARRKMKGLTKEQVLICMGVPDKKNEVGTTEVWQYKSGGGHDGEGQKIKVTSSFTQSFSGSRKIYCEVNVVMTNEVVSVVHYNGERGGLLTSDEQCGYAIEHCVE